MGDRLGATSRSLGEPRRTTVGTPAPTAAAQDPCLSSAVVGFSKRHGFAGISNEEARRKGRPEGAVRPCPDQEAAFLAVVNRLGFGPAITSAEEVVANPSLGATTEKAEIGALSPKVIWASSSWRVSNGLSASLVTTPEGL